MTQKKQALSNAQKQKNYRDRKKGKGEEELRGYLTPEALECYKEIGEVTGWNDSKLISNAIRLSLAAYKCGQIGVLNGWLEKNNK
ncbi:MAG: hypothetical protein ACI9FJ_000954 [Alteromonadaceae bacterium]|jgi:hypothetical protein